MDMSAGSTGDVRMDDLALGNGVTVVGQVAIASPAGHVLRERQIAVDGSDADDLYSAYDTVGSVIERFNSSAAPVLGAGRNYSAFGTPTSADGGAAANEATSSRGFQTLYRDADVDLYHTHRRWYSPELGLFTSASSLVPVPLEHPYLAFEGSVQNPPQSRKWRG